MRKLFAVIALVALVGCVSNTVGKTAAQAVYAAHGAYAAALSVAVQYRRLPACGAPLATALCSDAGIVAQVQRADDVAFAALSEAQSLARTPGITDDRVMGTLNAAQVLIGKFTSITNALGVK